MNQDTAFAGSSTREPVFRPFAEEPGAVLITLMRPPLTSLEAGFLDVPMQAESGSLVNFVVKPALVAEARIPRILPETSTSQPERAPKIDTKVRHAFAAAVDEIFEDGMCSEFSTRLEALVIDYGDACIEAVAKLLIYEEARPEIASEALRCLGRIDHPSSYSQRLWLLEKCLLSPSGAVRDAAALGLASLDDPRALPYVRQAADRERIPLLRTFLQQVVDQLEEHN